MRSTRRSLSDSRAAGIVELPAVSRGFTLVELLVVIGIIAVLMALLLPMLTATYKSAVRTRMNADLLVISGGLEAYRSDFADYPRVDYLGGGGGVIPPYGSSTLTWALLAPGNAVSQAGAPGDGADGPGFRIHGTSGQVYGPYIEPGRLKTNLNTNNGQCQIVDKYGHPYLYFAANKSAKIYAGPNQTGYVSDFGTNPLYTWTDGNQGVTGSTELLEADMQTLMGDKNHNGILDAGETPAYTGAYVLWGAGPDEYYGFQEFSDGTFAKNSDDVTNFNR